jgi:hypothetical protein
VTLVGELWKFGEAIAKKIKTQHYLTAASAAILNRDYGAAVSNYTRALEIERSPYVLMALGQVYMQRAANRLRAHMSFVDAMTLLADQPATTVPYRGCKLSARGLAGIQALATADVLADIHPEHWNDHVQDLVNATVFSFTAAAARQRKQSTDLLSDSVVTSPRFSSAINYYLAAKSAGYYPLAEGRRESVVRNVRDSVSALGLMAQYDEENLRVPANTLKDLWALELLPANEIAVALASY